LSSVAVLIEPCSVLEVGKVNAGELCKESSVSR